MGYSRTGKKIKKKKSKFNSSQELQSNCFFSGCAKIEYSRKGKEITKKCNLTHPFFQDSVKKRVNKKSQKRIAS